MYTSVDVGAGGGGERTGESDALELDVESDALESEVESDALELDVEGRLGKFEPPSREQALMQRHPLATGTEYSSPFMGHGPYAFVRRASSS
jgi:hypothetical protein